MIIDSSQPERRALLQNALAAVERMQAKLDAYEQAKREPIAIIGMSCRFPGGANSPAEYWQLLHNGIDAVTEIPADRKHMQEYVSEFGGNDTTWYGGFVQGIDQFDPQFFGLAPREATLMDPQQRMILEVSWEALERAGQAPDKLKGSRTGIFIGITTNDYAQLTLSADPSQLDAYTATGGALNVAPGRVAYTLGLQGPSMAVDTACSSSLVSVHLACQSLRNGESNLALAGGVNVLLKPEAFVCFNRWGMMSSDGHCKTFDARADGFVRGEGCGIIVLKRLSDAIADRDNILALIRGSAVNQDGRSSGLTVPNGLAQEAVIRTALANASVQPTTVSYVETHGTGTSLGDPIEVEALGNVLGEGRSQDQALFLSSVKTNLGHLESAAGIAGLIKVVLSMQHKEIPPHLHLQERSPRIPWPDFPTLIPTQPTPWTSHNDSRIAGVSAFGFSGTNAHIVLEEAPARELDQAERERPAQLLTLSAKTDSALKQLAARFAQHLTSHPSQPLAQVAFTANTGRAQFSHRLALVAESNEQAIKALNAFSAGDETPGLTAGPVQESDQHKIAFLFTGQGSQYVGMGRQLYETEPTFRQAMERCDEILRPHLERSILEILYPQKTQEPNLLDQTAYTQPALFALEYSLAQLWESWALRPAVVMGHSVGEYVAACVAGVFSVEDGLRLIAARGRLMQALPEGGKMAAVFAEPAKVEEALQPYTDQVSLAALNGPEDVVISGTGAAIDAIVNALQSQGVRSKYLTVSHAFHSPLMDPILGEFLQIADSIPYHPPQIDLISNISGELAGEDIATAAYWQQHVRAPVRFAESIRTLHDQGYCLFLEIGPKPTLLSMGQRCFTNMKNKEKWLPSLRPGQGDWHSLLQSLAALYVDGVDIDWSNYEKEWAKNRRRQILPTYPFQRQKYWLPDASSEMAFTKPVKALHPLLHKPVISPLLKEAVFQTQIDMNSLPYLDHHRLFGVTVFPATGYLEIAQAAARHTFGEKSSCSLKNITIQEALLLSPAKESIVQISVSPPVDGIASFQIFSLHDEMKTDWKLHAAGQIEVNREEPATLSTKPPDLQPKRSEEVMPADYYQQMLDFGIEYGESFRGILAIHKDGHNAFGHIRLPKTYFEQASIYHLHPAVLDACFQLLGVPLANSFSQDQIGNVYVPVDIGRYTIYQSGCGELWCHASLQMDQTHATSTRQATLAGNLTLFDDAGQLLAKLENIRLKSITRASLEQLGQPRIGDWLYDLAWKQMPAGDSRGSELQEHWLIFADRQGVASDLVSSLGTGQDSYTLAIPGQDFSMPEIGPWQVNPARREDFEQAIQEVIRKKNGKPLKVLYLWALDIVIDPAAPDFDIENLYTPIYSGALHLSQALIKLFSAQFSEHPVSHAGLWFVTRGAQAIEPLQKEVAIFQTPLWGFSRTLSLEHPDLSVVCVDLDPQEIQISAQQLLQESRNLSSETQVAYRGNLRFVARLEHSRTKLREKDSLRIDDQGQYLITGGLGGLGMIVARWLVDKGARHLTMLNRSAPSSETKLGLDQLAQLGAQISVLHGDVAELVDVARAFQQIDESGYPLKGIIHAAGALYDALLPAQTWSQFRLALKPKIDGAWNLHTLTKGKHLDFFVLFSAGAALLGSAGQANYAAANAFLDGLAYHRKMQNLPALSINWGGWSQAGMAARLGQAIHRRWENQGMRTIRPDEGLRILEELLDQDLPQISVLPIDWTTFEDQLENPSAATILSDLLRSEKSRQDSSRQIATPHIRKRIEGLPAKERLQALRTYVKEQFTAVLALKPDQMLNTRQGFTEMGMDSLMAVELSRRLQKSLDCVLPATLAFEYPTLEALTEFLAKETLHIAEVVESNEAQFTDVQAEFAAHVEGLAPDELEEALRAELKRAGYAGN